MSAKATIQIASLVPGLAGLYLFYQVGGWKLVFAAWLYSFAAGMHRSAREFP